MQGRKYSPLLLCTDRGEGCCFEITSLKQHRTEGQQVAVVVEGPGGGATQDEEPAVGVVANLGPAACRAGDGKYPPQLQPSPRPVDQGQ